MAIGSQSVQLLIVHNINHLRSLTETIILEENLKWLKSKASSTCSNEEKGGIPAKNNCIAKLETYMKNKTEIK